jgi:hypothetical protein
MTTSDLRAFAERLAAKLEGQADYAIQEFNDEAAASAINYVADACREIVASPSEAAPDAPPVMHTGNGPHPRTAREKAMYERGRAEGRAELDTIKKYIVRYDEVETVVEGVTFTDLVPVTQAQLDAETSAEAAEAEVARLLAREAELCGVLREIQTELLPGAHTNWISPSGLRILDIIKAALHSTGERHARVIAAAEAVRKAVRAEASSQHPSDRFLKFESPQAIAAIIELCDALAALKEPTDGLG